MEQQILQFERGGPQDVSWLSKDPKAAIAWGILQDFLGGIDKYPNNPNARVILFDECLSRLTEEAGVPVWAWLICGTLKGANERAKEKETM